METKTILLQNLKNAKNYLEGLGLKPTDTTDELRKRELRELCDMLILNLSTDSDGDSGAYTFI